jgi:hypothetical protein
MAKSYERCTRCGTPATNARINPHPGGMCAVCDFCWALTPQEFKDRSPEALEKARAADPELLLVKGRDWFIVLSRTQYKYREGSYREYTVQHLDPAHAQIILKNIGHECGPVPGGLKFDGR